MTRSIILVAFISILVGVIFGLKNINVEIFNPFDTQEQIANYTRNILNNTYPTQIKTILRMGGTIETINKDVISFKDSSGEEHSFLTSEFKTPINYMVALGNGGDIPISASSFVSGKSVIVTLWIDEKTGDATSLLLELDKSRS